VSEGDGTGACGSDDDSHALIQDRRSGADQRATRVAFEGIELPLAAGVCAGVEKPALLKSWAAVAPNFNACFQQDMAECRL
jgi:hypothetical protein